MTSARVPNYVAFVLLMAATIVGLQSPWGVLFLYWTTRSFYTRKIFLLSDVTRDEDPLLYWLLQIIWVALGLALIAADFFPGWR